MSAATLLVILVVGLIAGWLAGQVVKGTGFGLVADIAIGIVGALIGSWLLPRLGASTLAQALSLPSSVRPSARLFCCLSSGLFTDEEGGELRRSLALYFPVGSLGGSHIARESN